MSPGDKLAKEQTPDTHWPQPQQWPAQLPPRQVARPDLKMVLTLLAFIAFCVLSVGIYRVREAMTRPAVVQEQINVPDTAEFTLSRFATECQRLVSAQLAAPETAQFSNLVRDQRQDDAGGSFEDGYFWEGKVESASGRADFSCETDDGETTIEAQVESH